MEFLQRLLAMGNNLTSGRSGAVAGLSAQQEQQARQSGLMQSGLKTLLASQPFAGPNNSSPTALGALAQGLSAGQQAGAQSRQQSGLGNMDFSTPDGIKAALPMLAQMGPEYMKPAVTAMNAMNTDFENRRQAAKPATPIKTDMGNRWDFHDPVTGKVAYSMTKEMSESENAQQFSDRAEYYWDTTSDHMIRAQGAADAYNQLSIGSGAADVIGITAMMKIADPGSVVREAEFANALRTAGVPQRVEGWIMGVLRGELLADENRQQIVNAISKLVEVQQGFLHTQMDRERGIANRIGLSEEDMDLYVTDHYGKLPQQGVVVDPSTQDLHDEVWPSNPPTGTSGGTGTGTGTGTEFRDWLKKDSGAITRMGSVGTSHGPGGPS